LGERLWQARASGGTVDPASVTEPTSQSEAYAIQADVMRASGLGSVGFKVGSTSEEAQRLLGTTEPGSSPVLAPYFYEAPASVPIFPAHYPGIEGEFAYRLGADLPARAEPYTTDEVRDAIDGVAGAIEVVGTRLKGGLLGKGRYLVTADSGANIALVIGPWVSDWRGLDIPAQAVAVTIDGEAAGSGTGANALGDPMNVMVWLANQQSQWGAGMRTGMVVSTGTCTGIDRVKPGSHVAADFGALGRVVIDFA
jgi:2-keto-4-pentenoate hydratase